MPNTDPIFAGPSPRGGVRKAAILPIAAASGAAVVLAAAAALSLTSARPAGDAARAVSAAGLSTAAVARRTIRDIVSVSGTLELTAKEIVTSPGEGVVETVLVEEGDTVAAGAVLLRIDAGDLESDLEAKRLSLEKLLRQDEQETADRGFSARQLEIGVAAARRSLSDARSELERARALEAKALASASESSAAADRAESAAEALEQAEIKRDQAATAYELARKNRAVDRRLLETQIAELEAKIAAYVVRSKSGGTVYSVSVSTGGTVKTYQELAVVADPADVRAALDVPETRISSVAKGQEVAVYVGTGTYPARVESIAPSATSSSSSSGSVVRVAAGFLEKPSNPTIGASVSAEIVAGTLADALVLPRGPFLSSGNYAAAYVVAGGTATKKAASFGVADGSWIQVSSGLAEGDVVVTSDYRDFIHLDSFVLKE